MAVICPAVLASSDEEYAAQMHRVAEFASRVQIDLMDGELASTRSIDLEKVWWPTILQADVHLMYQRPMEYLNELLALRPHMVIVHAEADVHHMHFAAELHKEEIKVGLAVLPETSIESVEDILHSFDHLLIFSGDLGKFGGKTDLGLLEKVKQAREHHENIEIGWDGGVNDQNAKQLIDGGVDVLNVGGFIQNSGDAKSAYDKLVKIVSK